MNGCKPFPGLDHTDFLILDLQHDINVPLSKGLDDACEILHVDRHRMGTGLPIRMLRTVIYHRRSVTVPRRHEEIEGVRKRLAVIQDRVMERIEDEGNSACFMDDQIVLE